MRLAIVGASRIGGRTLQAWRECEGVTLTGVFSRSTTHGQHFAQQNGLKYLGPPEYLSHQETADFDAVYVTSLNAHHAADILFFLNQGKHVLAEKPLTLGYADALAASEIAQKKGLILQEGMMHRFHPELLAFRKAILQMGHNNLRELDLNFNFCLETRGRERRTKRGGGGALADLGCYLIDFLTWTFNDWSPCSLQMQCTPEIDLYGDRIDSATLMTFKLNHDITVRLACSITSPSRNLWEARGIESAISIERNEPQEFRAFKMVEVNEDSLLTENAFSLNDARQPQIQDNLFLFRSEFKNFRDAVTGKSAPMISVHESLKNAEILEVLIKERNSLLG